MNFCDIFSDGFHDTKSMTQKMQTSLPIIIPNPLSKVFPWLPVECLVPREKISKSFTPISWSAASGLRFVEYSLGLVLRHKKTGKRGILR